MVVNTGTAMGRHIGATLRSAREAKAVSLRELARRVGMDFTLLSRIERGERKARPEDVASILTALGVNGDDKTELVDLSREPDTSPWLGVGVPARAHQMAALLEFERTAIHITDVSPLLIPGLLQTTDYARAIMRAGQVPGVEIETRVMMRIGRKDALERADAALLRAFVGETALRQAIGSPEAMGRQLAHLRRVAALPNVDLRVIPIRSGWHPALEGPFMLLEFANASPIVQLENRRSGLFLHEEQDVEAYRQAADVVAAAAMSPEESARLIADIEESEMK